MQKNILIAILIPAIITAILSNWIDWCYVVTPFIWATFALTFMGFIIYNSIKEW